MEVLWWKLSCNSCCFGCFGYFRKTKKDGDLDKTIAYFDKKLKSLAKKYKDKMEFTTGIGLMRGIKIVDDETLGRLYLCI